MRLENTKTIQCLDHGATRVFELYKISMEYIYILNLSGVLLAFVYIGYVEYTYPLEWKHFTVDGRSIGVYNIMVSRQYNLVTCASAL